MSEIVVHHLERSRSHRVLFLLEELGLPYRIERYARDPETLRAPTSLRRLHPLGKSPLVEIDGQIFAESGAIIEAVLDRFGEGRLRPEAGTEDFERYRFFLHYAEGSLMPPFFLVFLMGKVRESKAPFFIKPVVNMIADKVDESYSKGEIAAHLAFLEGALGERPFVAGDELTGADIQMSYPVGALRSRVDLGSRYPNIEAYYKRLEAFPSFARAIAAGGPAFFEG